MHSVVDDSQTRSHSLTFSFLIWDGTCMLVGLFPMVEVVTSEKGGDGCLLQQSSVLVVNHLWISEPTARCMFSDLVLGCLSVM